MSNEGIIKKADVAYGNFASGTYVPTFAGLTIEDPNGLGTVIEAPSSHLLFKESDNADKQWSIEVAGGDLNITENGVSVGLGIADGGEVYTDRNVVGYANVGVGTGTFGTNAHHVLGIKNGTAPAAHVDDAIQVYSADSSDNTATLGLMLEQAVEDIGTFTASHKIKVFINGTAYWLQLDAV